MATVATTTNSTPLYNPSYSLIERSATNGYLYVMVKSSTANQYDLYRSTNNGTSWSLFLSVTRANIVEIGPINLLRSGYNQLAWCYRTNESSQDRIYLRTISDLGAASPAWNSEVLVSAVGNGGVAGAVYSGLDLMNHTVPAYLHFCVLAVGTLIGGSAGLSVHCTSGSTLAGQVVDNGRIGGTRQWVTDSGLNARVTPSINIEHGGDDRFPSSASNLWVTAGARSVRLAKLSWYGSGWAAPANLVTMASGFSASHAWLTSRWDKERLVTSVRDNGDTTKVKLYERNRSNTTTTERLSPAHTAGVLRAVSHSYDPNTGDARVYGVGTSDPDLYFIDYIRASDSWTTWAKVTATDILGANVDNWTLRRGAYGNARYDVLTAHSGAPNTIVHTAQTLSYTPSLPTWDTSAQPYQNGGAIDVAASLTLDWNFIDADPSDTQHSYILVRHVGAGSPEYWRVSDNTWQTFETWNPTAATSLTLTATQWSLDGAANGATDPAHTYKVRVRDQALLETAFGEALILIPSAKVNPTITTPPAGGTVTTDTLTAAWTVSEQSAYRVRLLIFGTELHDSGWQNGTATSYVIPYKLTDTFAYTVEVTTKNLEGLASNAVQHAFTVDFVEPAIPTLVVTPVPANGWISVAITNPAPSGGQPAVAYQDLYRQPTGTFGQDILVASGLASGATFNDWRAVHGQAYDYRSIVTGVNGTSASSAWTA